MPYKRGGRYCQLCLSEKVYIARSNMEETREEALNKRSENMINKTSLSLQCLTLDSKRTKWSLLCMKKEPHLTHQTKELNTVTSLPMDPKVLMAEG